MDWMPSERFWITFGDIAVIILALLACFIVGPLAFFLIKGFERYQESVPGKKLALYVVFYGVIFTGLAVLYYFASTKFLIFLVLIALLFWRWVIVKREV